MDPLCRHVFALFFFINDRRLKEQYKPHRKQNLNNMTLKSPTGAWNTDPPVAAPQSWCTAKQSCTSKDVNWQQWKEKLFVYPTSRHSGFFDSFCLASRSRVDFDRCTVSWDDAF